MLNSLNRYWLVVVGILTAVFKGPPAEYHSLGRGNETVDNGLEGHPYHNSKIYWDNNTNLIINATGNGYEHSTVFQDGMAGIIANRHDNEGVCVAPFFSHKWIVDCMSVTTEMVQSSTNGFRDQLTKVFNTQKESATELHKLTGALRYLQDEVRKMNEVINQSFGKVSSKSQFESLWAGLNPYSADNHGWITSHMVMWWIVSALIVFCFYQLIWKKSQSPEGDEGNRSSQKTQKELQDLRREIAKLTEMISAGVKSDLPNSPSFAQSKTGNSPYVSPPIPKTRTPTSSSSRSPIHGNGQTNDNDTDMLADFRAKLAKETEDVRRAQQEHYAKLREEKARKHEEEMRERESKFKTVMGEKIRLEKEEFLQWATIPD